MNYFNKTGNFTRAKKLIFLLQKALILEFHEIVKESKDAVSYFEAIIEQRLPQVFLK